MGLNEWKSALKGVKVGEGEPLSNKGVKIIYTMDGGEESVLRTISLFTESSLSSNLSRHTSRSPDKFL